MNTHAHEELKGNIWDIANRLRGPYRPPQYRLVMLPHGRAAPARLRAGADQGRCSEAVREAEAQDMPESAMDRLLGQGGRPGPQAPALQHQPVHVRQAARRRREHRAQPRRLHQRLLADGAAHLREIQVRRPDREARREQPAVHHRQGDGRRSTCTRTAIDNLQMGYLFEHLVMRFNEQANEEAGDHFTPREVIRLMANLVYTGETGRLQAGIYREIYDPACGTGGMLSESEKFILGQNGSAPTSRSSARSTTTSPGPSAAPTC